MCGIFGWIAGVNTQPGYDTLVELTDSLAHRGPDGGGYELLKLGGGTHSLALGHRRLSIIDLSNSSAQPMWSADGAFCVTFNGEIYNYIELRDELIAMGHRFRTASDTEVLIEAYRTWGEDSVRRFRGMFAFALYDTRNQSVFFARDQFGKKPLYFYEKNGDLVFSSEIWPLTRFPGFDDTFDWDAFDEYFLDRYVAGRRTFFRHILKLQPGCRSRWRAGALSIERYYTPPLASVRSDLTDYEEVTKLFAKTLDDAVRLRMRCDAPFGAFISGGMDSSAVVAIMTRHATKAVRTFSIDFSEAQYSEAKESAEIARLFGAHHTSVLITQEALFSHWDEALRRRGAPVCEGSDIPIMILSKRARNDVKMVLTGEGADELFGGYPKYRAELYTETYQRLVPACMHDRLLAPLARLTPHNRRLKVLTKALAVRDTHDRLRIWFGDMSKDERRRLLGRHASDAALDEFPFSIGGVSNFRRAQFFDQTSWLPGNLLERGDRMMMAGSIEGRMPFMDIELAALAARMPDSFHLRDGKTKAVLRSSMKGVLPQWVLSRKKIGFRVPFDEWFRTSQRDLVHDLLVSQQSTLRRILERNALDKLVERHMSGVDDNGRVLWSLMNLERFLCVFKPNLGQIPTR
jgi:asparagine synthase (glutamine-hydrolysing)